MSRSIASFSGSMRLTLAAQLVTAALWLAPIHAAAAQGPGWATAQATELTKQGQAHAQRGEMDVAARRYLDAIGFDPTYGPAYLGLGAIHERSGDGREAERAYAMGIDHVPAFVDGLVARGRLRAREGRLAEAEADLQAASSARPEDLGLMRELAAVYVGGGALAAALAVTRRMESVADAQGDVAAKTDAHVRSRALAMLLGDSDPVAAGRSSPSSVRRAIALRATASR